jgi:hypothetical protein
MEPVTESATTTFKPLYIPHHAVIREWSSTTKLWVVFKASCNTRNGTSLNDHLLIGPKLQQDLPAIVARWYQWHSGHRQDVPLDFGRTYGCWIPAYTLATESRISAATLSTSYCYVRPSSCALLSYACSPTACERWWTPIPGGSPDYRNLNLRWWCTLR